MSSLCVFFRVGRKSEPETSENVFIGGHTERIIKIDCVYGFLPSSLFISMANMILRQSHIK